MAPRPARRRRYRMWAAYAAFLILLIVCVELCARYIVRRSANPELLLIQRDLGRIAGGGGQRFQPAPYVNYRLTPGFREDSPDGGVTEHNSNGFRGPEWDAQPAPGVLRIACLGGSTTYGVSVADNADTYPAQLERALNERFRPEGWDRVEVLNLGVGGYTSAEVMANFQFYALKYNPQVILIQSAINDVAPRFYPNFGCDYLHFRRTWRDSNPRALTWLARFSSTALIAGWRMDWLTPQTLQARTQYPMPALEVAETSFIHNGVGCYRENIRTTALLAQARGIQVWLLTQFYLDGYAQAPTPEDARLEMLYQRGLTEHNAVLRQLALELDAGLVDLAEETPRQPRYFSDPIHMTALGNEFKGSHIARAIYERLPKPGP